MEEESAYHEHLDEAALESLSYLRGIVSNHSADPSLRRDAARFILRLHLAFHAGAEEVLEEEEEEFDL